MDVHGELYKFEGTVTEDCVYQSTHEDDEEFGISGMQEEWDHEEQEANTVLLSICNHCAAADDG